MIRKGDAMTKYLRCVLFSGIAWSFPDVLIPPVSAQTYPARPIRLIVPYPPGGAADNTARILWPRIGEVFGQQIVIDNRGGASGIIGADIVAKSAPDGYTLLHDASAFTVNPVLRKLPFDPLRDLLPVAMLMRTPNMLVVHPSVPVATTRDLIELAKAQPGRVTYASSGFGSAPHMAGELFQYVTKVKMSHVPYKGGGLAYVDLLGGHVQLFFGSIASALPHVQGNKLKGIALTAAKRSPSAPQIPTLAEAGVPGVEVYEWNGLYAPAGTAPAIVTLLNGEVNKMLGTPDVQQRFFQLGAEATPVTPVELGNYVRSEIARWGKTVKEMGIKGE
jgi:tripartite-type tricarboxylate transporter receptor subunit TctC